MRITRFIHDQFVEQWPLVLKTRVVAAFAIHGDETQRLAFVEDAGRRLYLLDLADGLYPEVGDEMTMGMLRREDLPVIETLNPKFRNESRN